MKILSRSVVLLLVLCQMLAGLAERPPREASRMRSLSLNFRNSRRLSKLLRQGLCFRARLRNRVR